MTLRIVSYWQTPVPPGFADHMIKETGLSERDQGLVAALRTSTGDTQYYADRAEMPLRAYNEAVANANRHTMRELIRLAVLGWQYEKRSEND